MFVNIMSRSRATIAQKERLLHFMRAHPDLAAGRLNVPDGARQKQRLMADLATTLNSFGEGATKTPDRWLKTWQDWKSDVKAKARKIRIYQAGTGGGPAPVPLTALEQELIHFVGPVAVNGLDVPDTLEVSISNRSRSPIRFGDEQNSQSNNSNGHSSSIDRRSSIDIIASGNTAPIQQPSSIQVSIEEDEERSNRPGSSDRDPMLAALRRQAEAVERQATAVERQATAAERQVLAFERLVQEFGGITAALQTLAQNFRVTRFVVDTETEDLTLAED